MSRSLEFEWDDDKAAANIAKHGISFDEAMAIWADPSSITEDASRPEDGERRGKAIGQIEGRLFIAVYVERGDAIRLISARRANRREERLYGDR